MKNFKNKKAFSLIELSIVLLIIGIIIAGVTQSTRIVKQFRISSARSQTESSPANSVPGMVAWFDATSERSFDAAESEDADLTSTDVGISTWYDINNISSTKNNATQSTSSAKPLYYANCMDSLPCVRFDGSNDVLDFTASALVGYDYTIFVVEQRAAAAAGYFIGKSTAPSANTGLLYGYSATSTVIFSHGDSSNHYTVGTSPAIAAYTTKRPRLHSFTNGIIALEDVNPTYDFYHYLDGSATASTLTAVGTPALSTLTAFTGATIGAGYNGTSQVFFNGDIGEIIIYNRYLKTEERVSVEDYLTKKWGITQI